VPVVPTPLIRPRQPSDLDTCVSILNEVHRSSGYPAHWPKDPAKWLTPSRLLSAWVAESNGEVQGHVALSKPGQDVTAQRWATHTGRPATEAAEITRLFVAETARGQALGSQLLDTACANAKERGLHPVLGVLHHNLAAVALYNRAGWQKLSTVDFPLPDGSVSRMHCYAAPS
jgi:ribosomal protein S18 acetylase RimI-like enzyme